MLIAAKSSFLADLLAPLPGRLERTLEITAVTSIVVLISMTFRIPDAGLSAYILFFVSKEDAGRSIAISVVFTVAILVVIALVFALLPISLDKPSVRILVIAGTSFVLFFLGSASKLAPLAGVIGMFLAALLNAEQNLPTGEIATRAVLYLLLLAVFPLLVQITWNVFAGRQPERLLRRDLAARLALAAAALRDADDSRLARRLDTAIAAGNSEMAALTKMSALLHRLPKDAIGRLKIASDASYGVLLATRTAASGRRPADAEAIADRLDELSRDVAAFPSRRRPRTDTNDDAHPISILVATIEVALSDAAGPLPKSAPGKKEKGGFFKVGAFTDPAHERFAAKATAAAVTCYLAFNLLDWPKISTCLITCFIVALSTNGESTQKMTLRLSGCILGAATGYAAIVFILPYTTSIGGLLILMACITLPAAWIAFGSPRIAYIGFQMAFAAYLCVLQGTEPKFDLAIARDRFIGILFGNVVVYVYFVSIYPASLLPGLTRDLIAIIERCRGVIGSIRDATALPILAGQIAEVQGLVQHIDAAVVAYGFEKRSSRVARLHTLACHLIQRSLHSLVAEIATLATSPVVERREEGYAGIDTRLAHLAASLERKTPIETKSHDAASGRHRPAGTIGAIHDDVDRLAVTVARYRRIVHLGEEGMRA